jgi:hypothetical protein
MALRLSGFATAGRGTCWLDATATAADLHDRQLLDGDPHPIGQLLTVGKNAATGHGIVDNDHRQAAASMLLQLLPY